MSRLASLTPSKSRSRASLSPSPGPMSTDSSPTQKAVETTHHRMLKLVLAEIRNVFKTWDELVIVDGFKAAKGCIDESTEMDNILQVEEKAERPEITPHLNALYGHRSALQTVLTKLDNCLFKISALIDQADKILFTACQRESVAFVFEEPLWLTWTLERFVNSLSPLLTLHASQLDRFTSLASTILSTNTGFDDAKLALEAWRDLAIGGERWEATREWEELVDLELAAGLPEEEEEDDVKGRRKRR